MTLPHFDFFISPVWVTKGLIFSTNSSITQRVFTKGIYRLSMISVGSSDCLSSSRNLLSASRMSQIDLESADTFVYLSWRVSDAVDEVIKFVGSM